MSETPVNLNKFRKSRLQDEARREADANSVKFGRTKAQRLLDATRNKKAREMLERHRIEDEA